MLLFYHLIKFPLDWLFSNFPLGLGLSLGLTSFLFLLLHLFLFFSSFCCSFSCRSARRQANPFAEEMAKVWSLREYHVKSLWDDQKTYPPYTSALQVVRLMQPEADIAQTCTSGTPRGAGNVSSVMKFEVENVRVQGTYWHVMGGNLPRTPAKLGALTAGKHRNASKGPAPLAQWAGDDRFKELDLCLIHCKRHQVIKRHHERHQKGIINPEEPAPPVGRARAGLTIPRPRQKRKTPNMLSSEPHSWWRDQCDAMGKHYEGDLHMFQQRKR